MCQTKAEEFLPYTGAASAERRLSEPGPLPSVEELEEEELVEELPYSDVSALIEESSYDENETKTHNPEYGPEFGTIATTITTTEAAYELGTVATTTTTTTTTEAAQEPGTTKTTTEDNPHPGYVDGAAIAPLLSNGVWQSTTDPLSHKTYYFNTVTNETTWDIKDTYDGKDLEAELAVEDDVTEESDDDVSYPTPPLRGEEENGELEEEDLEEEELLEEESK
jgi:hypothetical protein